MPTARGAISAAFFAGPALAPALPMATSPSTLRALARVLREERTKQKRARRTQLTIGAFVVVVVLAHLFGQWAIVAAEEIDLVVSASAVAAAFAFSRR